jgi:hypothetical protein
VSCVIVTLDEKINFYSKLHCPTSFIDCAGNSYVRYFADNDNGFFDWLRCTKGTIIGVRWFPYEERALRAKFISPLRKLDNVVFDEDFLGITIYFSKTRIIDETKSADQDFLENNLFVTPDGKCALSFSTDRLSEEEKTFFSGQNQ